MDEKVEELIAATRAWVAICMKQYPDSKFVDDKLVRVCAALSAFADKDWISEATTMFHHYRKESERNRNTKELCLLYAGKATVLHELLEKFGAKPKEISDETLLPCPFCGETPTIIIQKGTWGKIVCLNPLCLVKPEIYDDRRIADFEDIKDWKDVIISMWNKRAEC